MQEPSLQFYSARPVAKEGSWTAAVGPRAALPTGAVEIGRAVTKKEHRRAHAFAHRKLWILAESEVQVLVKLTYALEAQNSLIE